MRQIFQLLALPLLALFVAGPAYAVTGGAPDRTGEADTLMILSDRGGVCSALVVAIDAVLTAAHCVPKGAQLRVHFRDAAGQPVLIPPVSVAVHPGYRADAVKTRARSIDLALVRVPSPLPSRFRPATLSGADPRAGASLALDGYGVTREGDAASTGTLRRARLAVVEPYGPSSILTWAADPEGRGRKPGAGACQGDSGGPLRIEDRAFALASWSTGTGGTSCGLLTQGVRLGPQRGWIDATLARWGAAAVWE